MKSLSLTLIGIMIGLAAHSQTNQIVFVCEHGSAKSVIAATYFNKLAKENNLPWDAVARGTNPDLEISSKTKKILIEDRLFDPEFVPQKLSQQDVDQATQVILFYPLPETINQSNKLQNWQKIQSSNDDFKQLRDDILIKITPLIDSLKNIKHKQK